MVLRVMPTGQVHRQHYPDQSMSSNQHLMMVHKLRWMHLLLWFRAI